MLSAFCANTPEGVKGRFMKSTVPIAGQGLGEGKTYLATNLQSFVKDHLADLDKYSEVLDPLVAAYYLRVQVTGAPPRQLIHYGCKTPPDFILFFV